ncbi:MAG: ferrous iron transport protein A [Hespellia sp.]|nr:ferrous iron transport protein A [Hespellia sp.]
MPLTMMGVGEAVEIKRIGGKSETKKFLERLGFHMGEIVKIVSANQGNVIVQVKDSRVAINRGIANKIMV